MKKILIILVLAFSVNTYSQFVNQQVNFGNNTPDNRSEWFIPNSPTSTVNNRNVRGWIKAFEMFYMKQDSVRFDALKGTNDRLVIADSLGTLYSKSLSDFYPSSNPNGYISSFTETDPTVPSWAKSITKPSYSYSEITGTPTLFSGSYLDLTDTPLFSDVATSGSYNDLDDLPTIPTKTSDITNDSGFITDVEDALGYTPYNATNPNGYTSNSGTVTSIAFSTPTGFSISNSPITSSGTITLSYASGYQGYTIAESNKLSGIETNADVTDATNVASAGAFMKSTDDSDDIETGSVNLFMTSSEKTKLSGIATGAEVNVNTDWNATSGDAQLLNKPAVPKLITLSGTTTSGSVTFNISSVNFSSLSIAGCTFKVNDSSKVYAYQVTSISNTSVTVNFKEQTFTGIEVLGLNVIGSVSMNNVANGTTVYAQFIGN